MLFSSGPHSNILKIPSLKWVTSLMEDLCPYAVTTLTADSDLACVNIENVIIS